MRTYKRYHYYSKQGVVWTNWFPVTDKATKSKWQVKNKLLNEYKTI